MKTVENLLYGEYAKIIDDSAGFSKKEGSVTSKFKRLNASSVEQQRI